MRFLLSILLALSICIQAQDKKGKPVFHEVNNKDVVQSVFPGAQKVEKLNDYWFKIYENNTLLGYAMSSVPFCKDVIGYNDRTPVLIITDNKLIIKKVALLSNWETAGYVNRLTKKGFFNLWNNMSIKQAQKVEIDGYTGATITAVAVEKNVQFLLKNGIKCMPKKGK